MFFFEPYSTSFRILKKNIFLNNLHRISTMFKMAVSNRRQEGYIFVDNINTGGSEIHTDETAKTFKGIDHSNRRNVYEEPVIIDTVDSVMPKDVKPNFILMDVQMLELEALEGMKETLARATDLIVLCEWSGYSIHLNQTEYIPRMKSLLKWLEEHQYKSYEIKFQASRTGSCSKHHFSELSLEEFVKMSNSLYQKRKYTDVLFVSGHIDPN